MDICQNYTPKQLKEMLKTHTYFIFIYHKFTKMPQRCKQKFTVSWQLKSLKLTSRTKMKHKSCYKNKYFKLNKL